jgi:hypothetical protein
MPAVMDDSETSLPKSLTYVAQFQQYKYLPVNLLFRVKTSRSGEKQMIEKVVLYKQGKNIDPAIVFSAILDNNGRVRRNRIYRLYSGHGYNRG